MMVGKREPVGDRGSPLSKGLPLMPPPKLPNQTKLPHQVPPAYVPE